MQASTLDMGRVTDARRAEPILLEYVGRQVAAACVVAAAAWLVHRAGLDRQTLPYLVMAGAIVPAGAARCSSPSSTTSAAPASAASSARGTRPGPARARAGADRRARLVADQPFVEVVAATVAAVGLGVSALPDHLQVARRH